MGRAVLYDAIGGPEVLYLADAPTPAAKPGDVVVRVRAAGLNPFDVKTRTGFIPLDAPFPRGIGGEMAGTVIAVGDDAVYFDGTPVRDGDEVAGWGTALLATEAVLPAGQLAKRPAGVPVEVAAGLSVAGLTALASLRAVDVGHGDTVLVGGASGAVGILYSQLAIRRGARVVGTASEENQDFLHGFGITPIVYGDGLAQRVAAVGPISAVQDCHGREALDAGVALDVPKDRILGIAGYGAIDELGVRTPGPPRREPTDLAELLADVAAGVLELPIAATYPLTDTVAAYALLEGGHPPGKIVVIAQ